MAVVEPGPLAEPLRPRTVAEAKGKGFVLSGAKSFVVMGDRASHFLVFARNEFEWQRDNMGADLFPSGLAANRANLENFIGHVADQGLIDQPLPVESLFHESVLDT